MSDSKNLFSTELPVQARTRQELREQVVSAFLNEAPGTGTGKLASKYCYFVETLSDGRRVFLTRPAWLNKGFDFEIRVQDEKFPGGRGGKTDRPNHSVIFDDLKQKLAEAPDTYPRLFHLIERIYNCEEVPSKSSEPLKFQAGLPVDMILAVIKWFFIEQDVTYWNYWKGHVHVWNSETRVN